MKGRAIELVGLRGERNERGRKEGRKEHNTFFLWSSSNNCLQAHQFALHSPSLADNHDQSNMKSTHTFTIHPSMLVLVSKGYHTNPLAVRVNTDHLTQYINSPCAAHQLTGNHVLCTIIDSPNTVSPSPPQRASDENGGSTSTIRVYINSL